MAYLFEQLKEMKEIFYPTGAWYDYKSSNKFASEELTKDRPWFAIQNEDTESSPIAIARFGTTNPKGDAKNNFLHVKQGKFSKDGWIPNIRRSINLSEARFKDYEKDNELENKIKSFYKRIKK